jgi:hypothetical protein
MLPLRRCRRSGTSGRAELSRGGHGPAVAMWRRIISGERGRSKAPPVRPAPQADSGMPMGSPVHGSSWISSAARTEAYGLPAPNMQKVGVILLAAHARHLSQPPSPRASLGDGNGRPCASHTGAVCSRAATSRRVAVSASPGRARRPHGRPYGVRDGRAPAQARTGRRSG